MKKLLLIVALLLSTSPAYAADLPAGCRMLESELGVVELIDSRRVGHKGHKKHWYQFRGVKEYTYVTKSGDRIISETYDRAVPDLRKFAKQHPYISGVGIAGQYMGVVANTMGFFR